MWNAPTPQELAAIAPPIYSTENIELADKIIVAHFFIGGCDWYVAEYDPQDDLAWGYANLNDDHNSEWGLIHLYELRKIKVHNVQEVEYDLHWKPTPARDIDKIINK